MLTAASMAQIEELYSWGVCDVIAVRFPVKSLIFPYLVLMLAGWNPFNLCPIRCYHDRMRVWKAITRFVAFASICGLFTNSRHNSWSVAQTKSRQFVFERKSSDLEQKQYRKQLLHAISIQLRLLLFSQ